MHDCILSQCDCRLLKHGWVYRQYFGARTPVKINGSFDLHSADGIDMSIWIKKWLVNFESLKFLFYFHLWVRNMNNNFKLLFLLCTRNGVQKMESKYRVLRGRCALGENTHDIDTDFSCPYTKSLHIRHVKVLAHRSKRWIAHSRFTWVAALRCSI